MQRYFFSRLGLRYSAVLCVTVLCSVLVLALVAMHQLRLFGVFVVDQNRAHILGQAESYLAEKTLERSLHLHAVFKQAEAQVTFIASYVQQVLDERDLFARRNYNEDERLYLEPKNNIFSNRKDSVASCVYWGTPTMPEEIRQDVDALSHVDPLLRDVKLGFPGAAATWLITKDAIARYYPNIHHVDFMPPVSEYDYRQDLCYRIAAPEYNPERGVVWHEVYDDSMGQGLVVTVSAPAYSKNGEFLASAGMDVSLDGMLRGVIPADAGTETGGFSFVIDDAARFIAFPEEQLELFKVDIGRKATASSGALLDYSLLQSSSPAVTAAANKMLVGTAGHTYLTLDGEEYILAFQPLGAMGWTLGHIVPMSELLSSVDRTLEKLRASRDAIATRYLVVAVGVLVASLLGSLLFFNLSLFRPLARITTTVRRVTNGNLDARAAVRRDDELGELGAAVDEMAMQLSCQRDELLEAREIYRELFERAMSGLSRTTPDGKLLSANQSFADMFGYESANDMVAEVSDAAGQLWAYPLERKSFAEALKEQGELKGFECRMRRKDGSIFWMASNVRVERNEAGDVLYFEGSAADVTDRKRAENYRDMLSRELIRIQETERRSLAADLHDNLAQELSALKIVFEMVLDDQPGVTDDTRVRLEKCSNMLGQSIMGIRAMAQGLGPFGLEELGLEGMLREYCLHFGQTSDIAMDFQTAGLGKLALSAENMTHIFRIVQEALNNVNKHAQADTVKVRLVTSHPNLIVRVEDNGQGFDTRHQLDGPLGGIQMGLMSIRERARLLGGTALIDSIVGKGTRIFVEVPLSLQDINETS